MYIQRGKYARPILFESSAGLRKDTKWVIMQKNVNPISIKNVWSEIIRNKLGSICLS